MRNQIIAAAAAAMGVAVAAPGGLPDCTISFDGACPNSSTQCGADFSGGGGCLFAALPDCYSSGLRSYEVTPAQPAEITFAAQGIIRLEVFFAGQGAAAAGEMKFFDAVSGGTEIGSPLTTNGNCIGGSEPAKQILSFLAEVRRIEVSSSSGTVWIDDFRTNPPNSCPTDTNDDGTTGVDDLVNVITTWGTAGGVADVNMSGVVNVDDLNAVIVAWGDC